LPDPVVYISGGPGGPLTIYEDYQARHPYAAGRDLILVDQRGTGRSEPRLCPELSAKMLEADIAAVAEMTEDHLTRVRAIYLACRDAATGRDIDLNNFGTTVTAEDFDWVRQAAKRHAVACLRRIPWNDSRHDSGGEASIDGANSCP
jgi:pimeloyl-ACP methyl ester carboxylesterase